MCVGGGGWGVLILPYGLLVLSISIHIQRLCMCAGRRGEQGGKRRRGEEGKRGECIRSNSITLDLWFIG